MEFLIEYSPYIVLLPFFTAFPQGKSMSKERLFLFAAICLGMIGEFSMHHAMKLWRNNMPVVHIYTIIEFCLLLSVFYYGKPRILSKSVYRGLMIGFVIIGLVNMFYQGILQGNSIVRSLEGILLIMISLYYFFILLKQLEVLRPEKTFMFWFNIAILVYFGGNLLLFIYYNHINEIGIQSEEAKSLMTQLRLITFVLNIFLYLFYSIAFLCKESKTIPKSSWSAP